MNEQTEIEARISRRVARILLVAEAVLEERRFLAFRKLVLDEFGRSGLASELAQLWRSDAPGRSRIG